MEGRNIYRRCKLDLSRIIANKAAINSLRAQIKIRRKDSF